LDGRTLMRPFGPVNLQFAGGHATAITLAGRPINNYIRTHTHTHTHRPQTYTRIHKGDFVHCYAFNNWLCVCSVKEKLWKTTNNYNQKHLFAAVTVHIFLVKADCFPCDVIDVS